MKAVRVIVPHGEFETRAQFTFNGELALFRIGVLEVLLHRDGKGQKRQGESDAAEFEVILIDEERVGEKRIEALLAGLVAHGRKCSGASGNGPRKQTLEHIGGVQCDEILRTHDAALSWQCARRSACRLKKRGGGAVEGVSEEG